MAFKTVTGAINTTRRSRCSPTIALDHKSFSPGYWQWQHRFLLDAVRQFGFPSVLDTISPYEWRFPCPTWQDAIRSKTARQPTEILTLGMLHITHILEQLV